MDRRDPTLVEEIEDEVEIAVDRLPFRGDLADGARAARIEIECTVRHQAAQVRHGVQPLAGIVAALPVELDAFPDESLLGGKRVCCSGLADRRWTGRHLRLQLVDGRDQPGWTGRIADAPAG